jgi:hypothetical protein
MGDISKGEANTCTVAPPKIYKIKEDSVVVKIIEFNSPFYTSKISP